MHPPTSRQAFYPYQTTEVSFIIRSGPNHENWTLGQGGGFLSLPDTVFKLLEKGNLISGTQRRGNRTEQRTRKTRNRKRTDPSSRLRRRRNPSTRRGKKRISPEKALRQSTLKTGKRPKRNESEFNWVCVFWIPQLIMIHHWPLCFSATVQATIL